MTAPIQENIFDYSLDDNIGNRFSRRNEEEREQAQRRKDNKEWKEQSRRKWCHDCH